MIRNQNSIEGRRQGDLARAIRDKPEFEPVNSQLMKVVSSTAIDAANWRYLYTVRRAQVGAAATYTPAVTADTATESALKIGRAHV